MNLLMEEALAADSTQYLIITPQAMGRETWPPEVPLQIPFSFHRPPQEANTFLVVFLGQGHQAPRSRCVSSSTQKLACGIVSLILDILDSAVRGEQGRLNFAPHART